MAILVLVLAGCTNIATVKPPVRPIDHAAFPAGPTGRNVPIYRTNAGMYQIEVATVDSFRCEDPTADKVEGMLADLRGKGSAIGAEALVRARMLSNKRTGLVNNPRTPFPSARQGETKEYFLRATAVRFERQPEKRPPEATAADFAAKPKTGGGDEGGTLPFSGGAGGLTGGMATPKF